MSNDLRRVSVVAPCEGLSDFPTFFTGQDAEGLLSAWTAAWRPGLLAHTGRLPQLLSAYALPDPDEVENHLLLVPSAAVSEEVTQWLDDANRTHNGDSADSPRIAIIQSLVDRPSIIAAMEKNPFLEGIDKTSDRSVDGANESFNNGADHEAEFFALGYAYLQVEMLTLQIHSAELPEVTEFEQQVVDAAQAMLAGNREKFDAKLARCYDLLEQRRNHCYSVDIYLLDLVLVAETTLGDRLSDELRDDTPKTLLLTEELAGQICEVNPTAKQTISDALQCNTLAIAAGGREAIDPTIVSPEVLWETINRGFNTIERQFGTRPVVFGQFSSDLPPRLLQALSQQPIVGALLNGFDGREPPYGEQVKTSVSTIDGNTLPAVVAPPIDLSLPEAMLELANKLVATLERDHTATLLLVGWAGSRHLLASDLRRVAKHSSVLGRFVTLPQYFDETPPPDQSSSIPSERLGPTNTTIEEATVAKQSVTKQHDQLVLGLASLAGASQSDCDSTDLGAILATSAGCKMAKDNPPAATTTPFVANAWSFAQPISGAPDNELLGETVGKIPPMGFCIPKPALATGPPRVEGLVVRNERFEATIEPDSGGIQSLRTHQSRWNLLSQRLVIGDRRDRRGWLAMQVDRIDELANLSTTGALRSTGRLIDVSGAVVARFTQTVALPAKSEALFLDIEIEPIAANHQELWLASRLMVRDLDWRCYRGVQWTRLPVASREFLASDYLQLESSVETIVLANDQPTTYRRCGGNQYDALLSEGVARAARYRFAISSGRKSGLPHKLGLATRPLVCQVERHAELPESGWWLHLDAANVFVSRIEPIPGESRQAKIRLIETEGRRATANLRLWRSITRAQRLTLSGKSAFDLPLEQGQVRLEIVPYDWLEVELSW